MGNNIFSLRLNTAALAAAHSFLSSHEQYDIRTDRVLDNLDEEVEV